MNVQIKHLKKNLSRNKELNINPKANESHVAIQISQQATMQNIKNILQPISKIALPAVLFSMGMSLANFQIASNIKLSIILTLINAQYLRMTEDIMDLDLLME